MFMRYREMPRKHVLDNEDARYTVQLVGAKSQEVVFKLCTAF